MSTIELKKQERNIEIELINNKFNKTITKTRYFVAELVKKALDKYLDFDDMAANNSTSIYTLPIINEELNIIDFEVNSLSVHVVATVDKAKNQNVYIPQIYRQFHYKPDIILFVNFTKSFAKMEMVGFITDINFNNMSIPKHQLLSAENLIDVLKDTKSNEKNTSDSILNTTKELILAYIDKDLSDEGKRFFLKQIIQSKEVRKNYKLFYKVNNDFTLIAKNSQILKVNPIEQENKIDLQSRSDYLIDKAISKYEDENPQELMEEELEDETENVDITLDEELENSLITNYTDTESPNELLQNQQENILEFALDEITSLEEEPPIEEIVDTIEEPVIETINEDIQEVIEEQIEEQIEDVIPEQQEENIEDDTTSEITDNDNEIIDDNIDFNNFENEEHELSLGGDDEIMDLSQTDIDGDLSLDIEETQPITETEQNPVELVADVPEPIAEIQEDEENTEQEIKETSTPVELEPGIEEILNDNSDDELLDIAVDDDELTEILSKDDSISDYNSSSTQTNLTDDEVKLVDDSKEDDDLFEFLSEIAEENETPAPEVQEIPQETNEIPTQEQEFQQQENVQNVNDISPQPMEQANDNVELDSSINVQQYTQPQQKPKSNTGLLLTGVLLVALGTTAFLKKDFIMSKLPFGNSNNEIQGLALDNNDALPPPIADNANTDDTKTAETDKTAEADKTAPAPTAVATNNADEKNPPSAKDAPSLPNLPSTTVEPPKAKHMNDAIATALTKDFNGVRISKVSWEASETLVNNVEVKRYLTIAGKSIKNTLSQDLLAATEPSFKDTVTVGITYRKDGSVSKITVDSSSGSAQIDDIIKKSVDGTLKYVKMPALNLSTSEYTIKLVIRL